MSKQNKVVEFKRDGSFHFKLGMKYLNDNKIDDSIRHLKIAIDKSPNNYEYTLELGELLSELNLFEESNEVLYSLLHAHPKEPIDYFFTIACNFAALNRTDDAQSVLNQYLDSKNDGILVDDIMSMLSDIEEYNSSLDKKLRRLSNLLDLFRDADSAMLLMGDNKHMRLLDSLLSLDNTIYAMDIKKAASNAYLAMESYELSRKYAEELLRLENSNVTALCNLTYIHFIFKEYDEMNDMANKALLAECKTTQDSKTLAFALCRVGLHEKALPILNGLSKLNHYSYDILHFCAICNYNCGNISEALEIWSRLRKLYPFKICLGYYLAKCTSKINKNHSQNLAYIMDLPELEADILVTKIFDTYGNANDINALNNDDSYRHQLIWIMKYSNPKIGETALNLLCTISGTQAIPYLKQLLLKSKVNMRLKDEIFVALNLLGDDGPFIAKIDGGIAEVKVTALKLSRKQSKKYKEVIELVSHSTHPDVREMIDEIISLWEEFIRAKAKTSKAPTIIKPEIWAAALEYIIQPTITFTQLAIEYKISSTSISKAVKDIRMQLDK